ncbi:MAG TPA: cytosine deaminase [Pseudogracilibacillus sp.]|nr:cytosine deaminase [Pseudogracilibacillus sp.]
MDLIIRQATLHDVESRVDIGIKDGKFHKIAEKIDERAVREIDATSKIVAPPFVESHVHLDAALSAGKPRHNESGTLLEAIDIWSTYKETMTKEDIIERALKAVQWLVANGVLFIRAHTDTTTKNLLAVKALLEVKELVKPYVDIQVVAFPQDGIYAYEKMDEALEEAIVMGADVVGGLPQAELTREDGIRSIEYIFELAKKYEIAIDIHTDETGDPSSRFLEVIAKYALTSGIARNVTASHTTAMHNYPNDYAAKVIQNVKRSGMNIVTNPFSNALLQNRLDGYPKKRGTTRVDELLTAGVNISVGCDNLMDPFGPLGKGSMLQAAHMLAHTAHMSGYEQMSALFDMITINGAKTLNIPNYGIEIGHDANLIILDATTVQEAIRLTSECLYVIRNGNVISETKPAKRRVTIGEVTTFVDFN